MRIRSIKPEFWTSLTVAVLPIQARLTFIGLWNYCDDHGRGHDDARLVKAAIWPLDNHVSDKRVDQWLGDLADAGLIERYAVSGKRYLCITNWSEHQRVERPRVSLIPPRTVTDPSPQPPRTVTATSPQEGKGREMEQGKEGSREHVLAGSPTSNGGRPKDELFEAIVEVCEWALPTLTSDSRGRANDAAKQLRAVQARPAQVRGFAIEYHDHYPDATLTPQAITGNWPDFMAGKLAEVARGRRR